MRMRNEFPIREIVQREHIKVRIDEKQRSAFNLTTKPRNKYKCLTSQVSIFTGLSLCTITSYKVVMEMNTINVLMMIDCD